MNSNYKDFIASYTDVYPEGYCQHLIAEFERLVQGGAGISRQRGEGAHRHRKDDMQLNLNIKAHQTLDFNGKDTVDLFLTDCNGAMKITQACIPCLKMEKYERLP